MGRLRLRAISLSQFFLSGRGSIRFLVLILFLFVSRFFCLLILSSWPVSAASCVLLWFVRSLPRSVGFVSTSSVSDVQNLRRPVAVAVLPNSGHFGLRVDYESDPRGSAYRLPPARLLTSHATRAAGTRPSSACVEPLRRPLAVTAGWADTSASESACLHRGGHPTERAGSVVWACTPDPVDLSSPRWSPPLQRSAASALREGSHMPRAEENSHWIFFVKYRSYSGILKRDPADRRGGYIPRFPAVTKV